MAGFFSKLKDKMVGEDISSEIIAETAKDGYVELNAENSHDHSAKIVVRPFVLEDFDSIKEILDAIREGHTVALVNIKPLKDKDMVELKRAINKLKKTCDAVEGDIAGFGDDWIAAVPAFAHIHRGAPQQTQKKELGSVTEFSDE